MAVSDGSIFFYALKVNGGGCSKACLLLFLECCSWNAEL